MKTKKDHNKKDDDKTQRDGRGERESTESTRTAKQTDRQAADRQTRQLFCGYGKTRRRERERGSKLFDYYFFFASSSLNQNQNNCATPGKENTGGKKKSGI
jgi:hypothetical protein